MLSGSAGRFSGGLDVPALLKLDRAGILETWRTFFALMRDIAALPVPLAAALTGHSPAGGTVLALFADHRVLAAGEYLVGLNEVRVGLPVPEVLLRALVYAIGEHQAARLAGNGLLVGPEEALRVGLVDEVVPLADVVPRALAWAHDLLARAARAAMTADEGALLARAGPSSRRSTRVDDRMLESVTDQWFSAEAQDDAAGPHGPPGIILARRFSGRPSREPAARFTPVAGRPVGDARRAQTLASSRSGRSGVLSAAIARVTRT